MYAPACVIFSPLFFHIGKHKPQLVLSSSLSENFLPAPKYVMMWVS